MRRLNQVAKVLFIFLAWRSGNCFAQTPYVVLSPRQVMVGIDCTAGCNVATLTDLQTSSAVQTATITPVLNQGSPDPGWALVSFSGSPFRNKANYSLSVSHVGGAPADLFQIDTSPKVTVTQGAGPNSVNLRSSVAITMPGATIPLANSAPGACPANRSRPIALTIQLTEIKIDFSSTTFCEIDPTALQNQNSVGNPDALSVLQGVVVSRQSVKSNTSPAAIELPNLSNVLGASLQVDSKSVLPQSKAPATESAAWLWVDGTITAGTGAAPAWVVEEKFAPLTKQLGENVITWFAVTANIGNNKIGGQAAKDVIDFVGPSLTNYHDFKKVGMESSIAPTYETNRAFTHKNLLAVGDVIWDFDALNQSQFVRTARRNPPTKVPKEGDYKGGYSAIGWNLHFHTGFETGSALSTVDVKNPTTKAFVGTIPTYAIARLVPQVDGIYQYKWLQLEDLFTGRYLFATETTSVNDKRGNPYLEAVSGAKAVNALKFTVTPAAQHFAMTVTYTNGFAAPTYQRANGVKIGATVKY